MVVFLSCSSLSPFFHIPTFVTKPRNKQLLCNVPSFHQTTLQSTPLSTNLHKCFSQQKQSQSFQEQEQQAFRFERLFSNLNQATLKREPG